MCERTDLIKKLILKEISLTKLDKKTLSKIDELLILKKVMEKLNKNKDDF